MRQEIRLTPVELYFLGKQMNAKYIDYQYIAEMPGIQDRYTLWEQETLGGLEERGMLMEDFSGDVEIEENVKELLNAVFFGKTESTVQAEQTHRFHVHEGRVTHTVIEERNILLCEVDDADIARILTGLGSEVTVVCANVEKGMKDKTFPDLQKKEQVEDAVRFLKGEW